MRYLHEGTIGSGYIEDETQQMSNNDQPRLEKLLNRLDHMNRELDTTATLYAYQHFKPEGNQTMIQVQVTPQDVANERGNALKAFDKKVAELRTEYQDAIISRDLKCVQITMAEVDVSDWPVAIDGDKKETEKKTKKKREDLQNQTDLAR